MPKPQSIGQKFLQTLDEAVSRKEVSDLFKILTDFVKDSVSTVLEKMAEYKDEMKEMHNAESQRIANHCATIEGKMAQTELTMRSELRTTTRMLQQDILRVEDMIPEIPDLTPLEESFAERLAEVEQKIPRLPEEKDVEGMLKEIWERFQDELKKLREDMQGMRRFSGGGGTSAIGVQAALPRIVRTETPSGAINSLNVTYTVTQPISVVFSFSINGQFIPSGAYTYSGRTITMESALDTALSGTDFEIVYA